MDAIGDRTKARQAVPSGAPEPQSPAPLRLSALKVRIEPKAVEKFRTAIGDAALEAAPPATFPICWLTLPVIRDAMREIIGGEAVLPVHAAQSFAYERSLEVGADYLLDVELRREEDPPRLLIKAQISTPRGETCGSAETVLRLVSIASESPP